MSHRLPLVAERLSLQPPEHLYHYTSPDALIKICETRVIWGTGASFMNDSKEQRLAIELAQNSIDNRLNIPARRTTCSSDEADVLREMRDQIWEANRLVYTVSLSAKRDSVSEWKAYCPPGGGYAIGFPTEQLKNVAQEQGFYLAPCVYQHEDQYHLIDEIIDYHLSVFRATNPADAWRDFAEDFARFGPIVKHSSFYHEEEWRLISEPKSMNDPNLGFHPGPRSVVPHYEFQLRSEQYPSLSVMGNWRRSMGVIVGPTREISSAQLAVQALLLKTIGPGCWHGRTDSTYRGY